MYYTARNEGVNMQDRNMIVKLNYTALIEDFYAGEPDNHNWDDTRSNIISMLTEAGFGEAESLRDDEIILTAKAGDEGTIRTRIVAILQRNSLPVPDGIAVEPK